MTTAISWIAAAIVVALVGVADAAELRIAGAAHVGGQRQHVPVVEDERKAWRHRRDERAVALHVARLLREPDVRLVDDPDVTVEAPARGGGARHGDDAAREQEAGEALHAYGLRITRVEAVPPPLPCHSANSNALFTSDSGKLWETTLESG